LTVTIVSGGPTGNNYVDDGGVQWWEWKFVVNVNGSEGINGEWVPDWWAAAQLDGASGNDPNLAPFVEQDLIDWLDADPSNLGGISQIDGTSPDGRDGADGRDGTDGRDGPDGPDGDDGGDEGDGVLAGGGDMGDSA
jgi:hypothetical protein